MNQNTNLIKVETWFDYYKKVYEIFRRAVLINRSNNLSIQLSFFNSAPQEDEFDGIGQIAKLELFDNQKLVYGISLNATGHEEQLFQYVWILVVNHFIKNNYSTNSKIKIYGFEHSTRNFKYLLSDIKNNSKAIARANFTITYNKQEYDEMLHQLVLNHNNFHDNEILVQNVRNYIIENYHAPISSELNSSITKSKKVYENLIHNNYYNNRFTT
ncbi:MAG: hypothetical protein HFI86_04895 [Bacilli bacterium]|nr:hypothetical protein [Bacilli bacterium]